MTSGAKSTPVIPEQYRPKETDRGLLSNGFLTARGSVDASNDPTFLKNRRELDNQTDTLTLHNQSMAAANNGTTGMRMMTGVAATLLASVQGIQLQKTEEEKKREAMKQAMDALRSRLEAAAEYWHEKADAGERKLGGLNGIAQALGVTRKPGQSDEEFRRYMNDLILQRVARGELDPNSDLAIYAQDRQHDYDAQDALDDLDSAEQEAARIGDYSEFDQKMDGLEQKELMLRNGIEDYRLEFQSEVNGEVDLRDYDGEAAMTISSSVSVEQESGNDFFGFESAEAMEVTENFNRLAQGQSENKPTPQLQLQQTADLKTTGMNSAIG